MFDMQSTVGIAVSDDLEEPRARRKRRGRVVRDPGKMNRYFERKERQVCTSCGADPLPGQSQCAEHLASSRAANKRSKSKRRARLRKQGLCANNCGRKSESYRCAFCSIKAGELPTHALDSGHSGVHSGRVISDDVARAIHRPQVLDKITYSDGKTRNRSRGSGKRGGANQTAFVVDGQDLRYAKAALEKAIAGMVECEAPDVKELPRIQQLARRREWQAFADLARRHLDELLERGGYDADVESE